MTVTNLKAQAGGRPKPEGGMIGGRSPLTASQWSPGAPLRPPRKKSVSYIPLSPMQDTGVAAVDERRRVTARIPTAEQILEHKLRDTRLARISTRLLQGWAGSFLAEEMAAGLPYPQPCARVCSRPSQRLVGRGRSHTNLDLRGHFN